MYPTRTHLPAFMSGRFAFIPNSVGLLLLENLLAREAGKFVYACMCMYVTNLSVARYLHFGIKYKFFACRNFEQFSLTRKIELRNERKLPKVITYVSDY